jgi:uncharacterized lipoprotein YbaY
MLEEPRTDAPAPTIAEQKIAFGDRQVPIPFDLRFDPVENNARRFYVLYATMVVDGAVRFRNKPYRVITHGKSSNVDLVLQQVMEQTPSQP